MKKSKQTLLVIGSLIAILALSACGTDAPPAEPEPTPAPEAPAATPAPAVETPEPQETADEPVIDAPAGLPVSTATFTPGVYVVTVPGWQDAPMTIQVAFNENQIADIEILEHGESKYGSGWALRALPGVPDQILIRQSTLDIDTFTGATSTRESVIAAVEEAITLAGAAPEQLQPQSIAAPLPGDRFIPGFIEITVPANTMDIYGEPLTDGAVRMLYSEDTDMTLRLSFGRNEFHLHSGGALGLGQGAEGHGESVIEPTEVAGGALGGWWFRQVVNHQVNDRQSTQGIDTRTGATMSASGIVWGVEQAMIAQGADPAAITPRAYPPTQIPRNPNAPSDSPFFVPGIYTVTVEGFGGPMEVAVTLDRTNIRRIEVIDHNETDSFWDTVWGAPAEHVMRNAIFAAGPEGLDDVDLVSGATASSQALVNAVREAMAIAWVN